MAVIRAGPGDELEHIEPCGSLATAEDRGRPRTRADTMTPGRLMEGLRQYLLMMANQVIGPELQAKLGPSDLVQETFLEAQQHLVRFPGPKRARDPRLAAHDPGMPAGERAALVPGNRETSRRARSGAGNCRGAVRPDAPRSSASRAPSPSTHAVRNERAECLETGDATAAGALPAGRGLAATGRALMGRDRPANELHGRGGAQGLEPGHRATQAGSRGTR